MKKFNYQIVFNVGDDERIIFAGVAIHDLASVLHHCVDVLNFGGLSCDDAACESVVYQPVNTNSSCQEKEDPKATSE